MFNPQSHREAGQSVFMSSMKGLANTGAAIVTFLATPIVYGSTVEWVSDFAELHYGYEAGDLAEIAWFVLTALLVFFIARASLGTLLIMGGLAIATRFL